MKDSRWAIGTATDRVSRNQVARDDTSYRVVVVPHFVQRAGPTFKHDLTTKVPSQRGINLGSSVRHTERGDDPILGEPVVCGKLLERADRLAKVFNQVDLVLIIHKALRLDRRDASTVLVPFLISE